MPRYRVFYLKEELSRRFRELPPGSVRKTIKARDYQLSTEIEAPTEYSVWKMLQDPPGTRPLAVGDALERDDGKLQLCVFGGFEDVNWWVPEPVVAEAITAEPAEAPENAQAKETT